MGKAVFAAMVPIEIEAEEVRGVLLLGSEFADSCVPLLTEEP
jgi:hypothetical protein